MRLFLLLLGCLPFCLTAQPLTGPQLLKKSIAYHDPAGQWPSFKGQLQLTETRPNGPDRQTTLVMDNRTGFFRLDQNRDGILLMRVVEDNACHHAIKGVEEITPELAEKHRLTCERTQMLRNYYTYLWGLPMKLTDPGTIVHETVENTEFNGQAVLAVRVSYEEGVGEDTWYFYFHPQTAALVGCRFFHDETQNDGEYLLFSGEKKVRDMRLPAHRKWYTNAEAEFLGADILR